MRVVWCLLIVVFAAMGWPSYAAQPDDARVLVQRADHLAAPGGTVRFVGAIVVGTASTPLADTAVRGDIISNRTFTGRFDNPSRMVSLRRMAPTELSSQITRLERAGERISTQFEALVSYQ